MPTAFNDVAKVIKLHVPIANAYTRVDILEGKFEKKNEFKSHMRHSTSVGAKDTVS